MRKRSADVVRNVFLIAVAGFALLSCAAEAGPTLVIEGVAVDDPPATDDPDATDEGSLAITVSGDAESDRAETSKAPPFTVVAHAAGSSVEARTFPDSDADLVAEFHNPTAIGGPLVFKAVDGSTDGNGEWIEVLLPVQPNGTTGWVRRQDVTLTNNPYRIEVDRESFSLRVYRQNVLWLETVTAIGTGNTPTPVGDFYLMELLAPPDPNGAYGPFAFGLSGFSEVLNSFGGADTAIIGLHGTNDPTALGSNVSHGCVRIENSVIERLAENVPLGTPVAIT